MILTRRPELKCRVLNVLSALRVTRALLVSRVVGSGSRSDQERIRILPDPFWDPADSFWDPADSFWDPADSFWDPGIGILRPSF